MNFPAYQHVQTMKRMQKRLKLHLGVHLHNLRVAQNALSADIPGVDLEGVPDEMASMFRQLAARGVHVQRVTSMDELVEAEREAGDAQTFVVDSKGHKH